MEKKIKVVDLYEGYELIGKAKNLEEVKKISQNWFNDTDGECHLIYIEPDEKDKYLKKNWVLVTGLKAPYDY